MMRYVAQGGPERGRGRIRAGSAADGPFAQRWPDLMGPVT